MTIYTFELELLCESTFEGCRSIFRYETDNPDTVLSDKEFLAGLLDDISILNVRVLDDDDED